MFEEILNGISARLFEVFGEGYRIYGDRTVEQGLTEPCFFISLTNEIQTDYMGTRFSRSYPMDIMYFSQTDGDRTELHTVAERLLDNMKSVTVNAHPLFGRDLHYEIIDKVLHFFISYAVTGCTEDNGEVMETLAVDSIDAK